MNNLLRLLSVTLSLGLLIACDSSSSGGSSAPQGCNNSSECPSGYECIPNSQTTSEEDHPLSPGYAIQALSCTDFCVQGSAKCGVPMEAADCAVQCSTSPINGASSACYECLLAQPDICSENADMPSDCEAPCNGGEVGGAGGASNVGGSSQGGSTTAPGGGTGGNSTSTGGSNNNNNNNNNTKAGVCRAKPSNNNNNNTGGNCEAICQKQSSCKGSGSMNDCLSQCANVSDSCRSCVGNAPDICSPDCISACADNNNTGGSAQGGNNNTGGQVQGGQAQGGQSSSENTCTINGVKYNCPTGEAAQKCFETSEPGDCTQ